MRNQTSTLTLRLIDQVSGPAKKASASMRGLDRTARATVGRRGGSGLLAGMGGRLAGIATAAAGYGAVRGVSHAVTEYAKADRALTRVRITAEASKAEIEQAGLALRALAQEVALPIGDMVRGLDILVQTGLSLKDAMAFLPSVAAAAQATGSATDDIAMTASAMSKSLKVPAKDMAAAFDALAASGKAGSFEIRDMAQHLPRVAASAAKLGFVGVDGVQRLGAMLEISKDVAGTAESAAIGVADAMEKILSPTVLKAAKKHGLDFLKILEGAQKHGENGAEAIVKSLMTMTAGMNDVRRNAFLSSIFTEADSRRLIVAMIQHWAEYQQKLAQVKASHGMVAGDVAKVTNDAESAIQRLSNAWNTFLTSSGKLAYDAGVGGFLEDLNIAIRAISEGLAQINDAARDQFGGAPGEFWDKNVRQPARAKMDRLEAERHNPALRDERLARERMTAAQAEAERQEGIAAAQKGNRRVHPAQRAASEEAARAARAAVDQAIADLLAAGRKAAANTAYGGEIQPSSPADFNDVSNSMGTVGNAMNMAPQAGAAGAQAMQAFAAGLKDEMAHTLASIDSFVATVQGKLSFTAAPSIRPQFITPPGRSIPPSPAPTPGAWCTRRTTPNIAIRDSADP